MRGPTFFPIMLALMVFPPGSAHSLDGASPPAAAVDPGLFSAGALTEASEIVPCTLDNGDAAECARLVAKYPPDDLTVGPFCPAKIGEPGGIWDWRGHNPGLYRVDEAFLRTLDALGYTFFDPDGAMHVSDTAVAEPVDDHARIAVSLDDTVEMTVLLPVTSVLAGRLTPLRIVSKVGLALDGAPIFSDAAPVEVTGPMPALDLCGGHVDPGGWYHWHATSTDIETVFDHDHVEADCGLDQDVSKMFGYAFDGLPLYGSAEMDGSVPTDLDACSGHVGRTPVHSEAIYHYHASIDFPNLPPCLSGDQARDDFTTTAQVGIGASPPEGQNITRRNPPRPGGPGAGRMPLGFDKAAAELGVSEDELARAVADTGGLHLRIAAAAKALGLSETDLRSALLLPAGQ